MAAIKTIQWVKGTVRLIDQTRLPGKYAIITCRNIQTLHEAIRRLSVRGAPAIGVAAALGVVLGLKTFNGTNRKKFDRFIEQTCGYLAGARPTAVNLFNMLDEMRAVVRKFPEDSVSGIKRKLLARAMEIYQEDRRVCRAMGRQGATLINDGMRVLTICNTGALATVDYGTAAGALYAAQEAGKKFSVYACETRPLLQGARLTTWELTRKKIDVTLICDNMAATLMQQKKVDIILAGADRIARNGDTANKIGTYMLAVLARHHRVPFYIVAPRSTFDLTIRSGAQIPIEERRAQEVTHFAGLPMAAEGVKVFNPAFDVTPHQLITGIVTEKGIIRKPFRKRIANMSSAECLTSGVQDV